MKITLEKLKKIVNEEIEQVVFENNINKIINDILPDALKSPLAKKTLGIAKRAAQKKQISVNDLIDLSRGIKYASDGTKIDSATAMKSNSALKKLNLDIVIGDITQNVKDSSRYAGGKYPKSVSGDALASRTYGASVGFSY